MDQLSIPFPEPEREHMTTDLKSKSWDGKELVLMADPSPQGYMYGFPKAVPPEVVEGKTDMVDWLIEEGYPREWAEDGIVRHWYAEAEEG